MDLQKVLAEMHQERERLKALIARVERMSGQGTGTRIRRAPPKGLNAAARKAASARMKAYWEKRKLEGAASGSASDEPSNGDVASSGPV